MPKLSLQSIMGKFELGPASGSYSEPTSTPNVPLRQSFHGIHRGSSKYWPTLQFRSAVDSRVGRRCPPKAKTTRSNRVGCAIFPLFCREISVLGLNHHLWLIRASKQSNHQRGADGFVTDDNRSETPNGGPRNDKLHVAKTQ